MAQVFVYAPNADDFDCLGECGPLTPTKCVHTEDANGMSEIALDHPIDENNRWSFLQTGYILKAEVPVRTCPEVTEAGAVVTALEKWAVKMSATKGQRYLYSKATGGRKKKLLDPGTEVIVTKRGASRYKAKTRRHSGWIAIAALENMVELTVPEDPDAIEQVVPAWTVRPQLFRIIEAVVGDKGVSVKAEHIFYDLRGNLTTYAADNPTCVAALGGILGGCALAHEFEGYTNMLDTRIIDPWTRVNPVDALLNPEAGLIARWGGELVRDDQEFYVLNRAGMNRGVRIAYGKNLLGVDCTVNEADVITHIMPVGQTSKGKPLLLAVGSYMVDGVSVDIYPSLTVAADNAYDLPTPHAYVLDVGKEAKAAGTSGAQILAARVKMIRAALRKYADEECNLPSVNLKVNFIALGDTAEYAQYRQLEDVYLYDSVRIYHPKIGIDVTAQVNRVEFDCLLERFNGIELGAMRRDMAHTPVATWQVPSALPGYKMDYEGLDASRLADGAVTDDQIADAAVIAGKIAELAVQTANIQDAAIETAKIKDAAIETAKIKDAAITTAKIGDAQITNAKIALLAVQTANIQDAAIETAKIKDAAITRAKIGTAAIGTAEIENASITTAKIALGAITDALIQNGAIGTAQIADASITDGKIINLSANRITAGTLSVERLVIVGSNQSIVFAINDANGTAQLSQTTIDGGSLTQRTITADRIVAEAITAAEIASNAITANKILANAVTTDKINALAITTDKLAAGAITAAKIAAGTITADKIDVDDLFASTAFLQNLQVSAAPRVASLPSSPVVGQSVIYTGVTPNEYLQWTGKGINPTQRRYSASETGASVVIEDLSDNRALGVTVKTIASQAGSGTPSPDNVRAISGKASALVVRRGKNQSDPTITGATTNGITLAYDAATQTITLNGTCTTDNAVFNFYNLPARINGPHVWSVHYVGGSASLVGSNRVQATTAGYAAGALITLPASGKSSLAVADVLDYAIFNIRVSPGTVLTNYKFRVQCEYGSVATDYELYASSDHTLTPAAPLYGMTGYEDEIGNDGHETHRTALRAFDGAESWTTGGTYATTARFDLATGLPGGRAVSANKLICSHFNPVYGDTTDTEHCRNAGSGTPEHFVVYINKSRMAGWSDAWNTAQKVAAFQALLAAWNTAGSPMQVLYQLETPTTATVAPVQINGADGVNTVTGDGASVTVTYTGSGWEAVGAVQRVAIENVEITPELGIKVSQILTDGTNTKNVYTQLNSNGLKIFDADTGEMIGGLTMQGGEVFLFSSALADPRSGDGKFITRVVSEQEGAWVHQGLKMERDGENVASILAVIGHDSGLVSGLYIKPADGAQFEVLTRAAPGIDMTGTMGASAGEAYLEATQDGAGCDIRVYPDVIYVTGHMQPGLSNTYDLGKGGSGALRWRYIYSNNSLQTSDERYKRDISPIDRACDFIMALNPFAYRYVDDPDDAPMRMGVGAMATDAALDACGMSGYAVVNRMYPESLDMAYTELIAPLIATVQSQQRRIDDLERRLAELEKRLG